MLIVNTAKKGKVLSFGEVLLRMSPQVRGGWIQQQQMPVYIGGAETNVAAALALWDVPAKLVTALPPHYLGDDILSYLAGRGVDISATLRSGSRVGIYYLQQGTDLKHSSVVYDRALSSFYELRPGMIDWSAALDGVSWFNFSAITPALNEHMPAICLEVLEAARSKGITVSLDLNYRSQLWRWGKQPHEVMPRLAQYCDLIMGNIWAANKMLGMPLNREAETLRPKDAYLTQAEKISEAIMRNFPHCKAVANTFRFEREPAGLEYYTTLYIGGAQYVSPHFITEKVVDKVGSGDCFMAGLIFGFYNGRRSQQVVDFASAAAIGKLGEQGDSTGQTVDDVMGVLQKSRGGQPGESCCLLEE